MKRILVISLMLAMILTLLIPSVAMAARPDTHAFNASGVLTGIDTGNVKELGNGLWLVKDRHITGTLEGDLAGDFTLTYGGQFALPSQEGNLKGKMVVNDTKTCVVTGKVSPYEFVAWYDPVNGIPILKLNIQGNWVGIKDIKAKGNFSACFNFIPTADGHVAAVLDSSFVMEGKYTGRR